MKLNWKFQEGWGWGIQTKKTFHGGRGGGDMDIFWNRTLAQMFFAISLGTQRNLVQFWLTNKKTQIGSLHL